MVSTKNILNTGRSKCRVQRPTIAGESLRFDNFCQVLSPEEQEKISKARGLCPGCGYRTHAVSTVLRRLRPLDNKYVSNGVCRACNPTSKRTALLQRASKLIISNTDPKRKVPSTRRCVERQRAVGRLSVETST